MNTITIKDKQFIPLIDAEKISQRVKEMAEQINKDYAGKKPLFIAVLNGSFMFAAALMKRVTEEVQISFVKFSSYSGMSTTGNIKEAIGLTEDIKGRHVVIIEDIVDTGQSLHHFLPIIEKEQPASLSLAVLLYKPAALKVPLEINYTGFEIEDKFVIGYGMDYDGWGRNLEGIYQLRND